MEVISPWAIYWVLQLDSISGATGVLCLAVAVASVISLVAGALSHTADPEEWYSENYKVAAANTKARAPIFIRWGKRLAIAGAILFTAHAFIPSTKAMAAIIVIPAIANSDRLQREAGDLYDLAKQALRQAVADDKPAKSDESK